MEDLLNTIPSDGQKECIPAIRNKSIMNRTVGFVRQAQILCEESYAYTNSCSKALGEVVFKNKL